MPRKITRLILYGGLATFLVFAGGFVVAMFITDRGNRRTLADRTGSDLMRFAELNERLRTNDVAGAMKIVHQEVAWRNDVLAGLRQQDPGSLDSIRPTLQLARRSFAYSGDPAFARVVDWEVADVDRARIAFDKIVLSPHAVAPELSIDAWIGNPHSLADLRGKVVLLDFWATTCTPCIAGMPQLRALQKEFETQGLVILTIHARAPQSTVERFIQTKPIGLPVGIDSGRTFDTYGIHAMPTKVLINKAGKIVWSPDVLEPSRQSMTNEQEMTELREELSKTLKE